MAESAAPASERPLTLEEKKAAARERARAAREAQQEGAGAGLSVTDDAAAYIRECADREDMAHAVRLRIHAGGWRIADVTAFDLFPETRHVETVITLDRT